MLGIDDPDRRAVVGDEAARLGVVADRRAVVVDQPGLARAQDDRRLALQHVDAAAEEVRRADVVVRRPFEIATAGALEDQIVVGDRPDVGLVADIADPRVPALIGAADLLGAVGRSVVLDQKLEVAVGLGENRFDRLGDVGAAIEDRYPNRDPWGLRSVAGSHGASPPVAAWLSLVVGFRAGGSSGVDERLLLVPVATRRRASFRRLDADHPFGIGPPCPPAPPGFRRDRSGS